MKIILFVSMIIFLLRILYILCILLLVVYISKQLYWKFQKTENILNWMMKKMLRGTSNLITGWAILNCVLVSWDICSVIPKQDIVGLMISLHGKTKSFQLATIFRFQNWFLTSKYWILFHFIRNLLKLSFVWVSFDSRSAQNGLIGAQGCIEFQWLFAHWSLPWFFVARLPKT